MVASHAPSCWSCPRLLVTPSVAGHAPGCEARPRLLVALQVAHPSKPSTMAPGPAECAKRISNDRDNNDTTENIDNGRIFILIIMIVMISVIVTILMIFMLILVRMSKNTILRVLLVYMLILYLFFYAGAPEEAPWALPKELESGGAVRHWASAPPTVRRPQILGLCRRELAKAGFCVCGWGALWLPLSSPE